jgi:hypothetical protein
LARPEGSLIIPEAISLVERFRLATLIEDGVMKRALYVAAGSPQTAAIYHAKSDNRGFYLGG